MKRSKPQGFHGQQETRRTIPVLNRPRIARVGVDVAPEHLYRICAHLLHLLLQEPLDVLSAGRFCQTAGVSIEALGGAATVSPPGAVHIDNFR